MYGLHTRPTQDVVLKGFAEYVFIKKQFKYVQFDINYDIVIGRESGFQPLIRALIQRETAAVMVQSILQLICL